MKVYVVLNTHYFYLSDIAEAVFEHKEDAESFAKKKYEEESDYTIVKSELIKRTNK